MTDQDQGVTPTGSGSRERNPQAVSAAVAASIPDAVERCRDLARSETKDGEAIRAELAGILRGIDPRILVQCGIV
jgi:hypothetical protein